MHIRVKSAKSHQKKLMPNYNRLATATRSYRLNERLESVLFKNDGATLTYTKFFNWINIDDTIKRSNWTNNEYKRALDTIIERRLNIDQALVNSKYNDALDYKENYDLYLTWYDRLVDVSPLSYYKIHLEREYVIQRQMYYDASDKLLALMSLII